MTAGNPHLATDRVLAGTPLPSAELVAVLVHGRDQGPEVMLEVAERLALADVGYVLPVAHDRSWYPGRFFDPIERNEPHLSWSLAACDAAIALAVEAGFPLERIVLGGFSQGACVAAELVARHPRPLGGVAVLTGALMGPDDEPTTPAPIDGLPMFLASSRYDEWIPLERARATAEAFERAGASTRFEIYDDREHQVSDASVAGLRALIERAR